VVLVPLPLKENYVCRQYINSVGAVPVALSFCGA